MKTCCFPACGLPHQSRGYCKTHYAQLRYHSGDSSKLKPIRGGGTPPSPCNFPECQNLSLATGLCDGHYKQQTRGEDLREIKHYHRVQPGEECVVPECGNRPVMKGVCKSHQKLRTTYRLSDEQIETLFTNPRCEVCRGTDNLHVDHDHSCCGGAASCGSCVRGLLCHWCNTALGLVKEDPTTLRNLINYLESK